MAFFTKVFIAVALVALAHVAQTSGVEFNGYNGAFGAAGLFPGFPTFGNFPKLLSVADIAKYGQQLTQFQPPPGSNYNSMSVQSSSHTTTDENGNIVNKGGVTAVVEKNGKRQVFQTGDAPPDPSTPIHVFPTVF